MGGGAGGNGRGMATKEAQDLLHAARARREKAEAELLIAYSEESDTRARLTGLGRLLGDALKGWRKDLEKTSVVQDESKKLTSCLWTLCSHRRQQNATKQQQLLLLQQQKKQQLQKQQQILQQQQHLQQQNQRQQQYLQQVSHLHLKQPQVKEDLMQRSLPPPTD
mmetsp:Transcript_94960/g.153152  ORF Transcript_94960/g.153152 Transcript_94960/m.153152 type:complete len:165 (+) Transcript_94960:3-497(+)